MWSSDGLYVNYSADGGAVWGVPAEIPEPASGEIGNPVITALGGGYFLLAYTNNVGSGTQTFIETFSYQGLEQAPTAISTIQTSGTTSGAEITIPAGTIGESDTVTIVEEEREPRNRHGRLRPVQQLVVRRHTDVLRRGQRRRWHRGDCRRREPRAVAR